MSRKADGKQAPTKRFRQSLRTSSPKYDRYARQRKPDHETAELIRFVRENQVNRQPTVLKLQQLAPLPGIGQSNHTAVAYGMNFLNSSVTSFDGSDETSESYPDLDDDLDSEVALCTDRFHQNGDLFDDSRRSSLSMSSGTTYQRLKSRKRGKSRRNSQSDLCNRNLVRSRKLPPLQRDDAPDRPSAPVPCRSPEVTSHSPDEFSVVGEANEPREFSDEY